MIDAAIEMAFLSRMVHWLNLGAGGPYPISHDGGSFLLAAHPAHILTDQGHTSNGAAGTAFILVGLGGIVVLSARRLTHTAPKVPNWMRIIYFAWLVATVLGTMLTLGALIYVNVVTNRHKGNTIDVDFAASLDGKRYTKDTWTPNGWFAAVLKLPLEDDGDRKTIEHHVTLMCGWRWNLIPLFIAELAVCVLALADAVVQKRGQTAPPKVAEKKEGEETEVA